MAKMLKDLGFEEGIMIGHLKGHDEAARIIKKIFSRGWESWPWARSVFYKLKQLGFAEEGSYYIVELKYENSTSTCT